MNTETLDPDTQAWLEAIEINPFDWVDGMLETMLDHDCVSDENKAIILRRYKSLLN
jgi:hypothetical protein